MKNVLHDGLSWLGDRGQLKNIIYRICTYLQYATISDPFQQDIISKVDANKDKKISATEIIERCFAKLDADQDGKISKEEFVNACSNSKEISTLLAPSV